MGDPNSFKEVIEALDKCWKPKNGMFELDPSAAYKFVGDYEGKIRSALSLATETKEVQG